MLPRNMLARTALCATTVFCLMARAIAMEDVKPGQSLGGVSLGAARSQAVRSIGRRLAALHYQRQPSHTYRHGITEDLWSLSTRKGFEVLSQNQRVVQIREWTSEERGLTDLSFAELLLRHPLRKSVYSFDDPSGGGYIGFYYDDLKDGICYTLGTQDDFLLTYHPDAIVVHRPGVSVLPIEYGVRGKRESGPNTRAYADEAAARLAERREQKDH